MAKKIHNKDEKVMYTIFQKWKVAPLQLFPNINHDLLLQLDVLGQDT